MMGGYPSGGGGTQFCQPAGEGREIDTSGMYPSRGVGPGHDDESSVANGSSKDKGRGSYKCGRVSGTMPWLFVYDDERN